MLKINAKAILNYKSTPTSFIRTIATSKPLEGKRNFRKFLVYNKRGTKSFKEAQQKTPDETLPIDHRGVKPTGFVINGKFMEVKEKIPELIVPDLTNCKLKPYVSYRVPDITQSEFTSEELFNTIYGEKIIKDFKEGQLNLDGSSKSPSKEELLTSADALKNARKTGSDIF